MKKHLLCVAPLGCLLLLSFSVQQASAIPVTELQSANFNAQSGEYWTAYSPFDSSKGDLLSVNVTISGQLYGYIDGGFYPGTPVPTIGYGVISQSFFGSTWPCRYLAYGVGWGYVFNENYNISIDINASDTAFVSASSASGMMYDHPTSIDGISTSSFLDTINPGGQYILVFKQYLETSNNDAMRDIGFDGLWFESSVFIDVSYIYEPNSGTVPVAETGTMMLLGSGLAGLVGFGRRRLKK